MFKDLMIILCGLTPLRETLFSDFVILERNEASKKEILCSSETTLKEYGAINDKALIKN